MSARQRLTRIMQNIGRGKQTMKKPVIERAKLRKRWDIVRGDKVEVTDKFHKERGKQGIVTKVLRKLDRLIVAGVNLGVKNYKGNLERGIKGRRAMIERTLPYWAVNLVDPVNGKPTRISRKFLDDGTKVRVSKKTGAVIPKPAILTQARTGRTGLATDSCTVDADVWKVTYVPGPKKPEKYEKYKDSL